MFPYDRAKTRKHPNCNLFSGLLVINVYLINIINIVDDTTSTVLSTLNGTHSCQFHVITVYNLHKSWISTKALWMVHWINCKWDVCRSHVICNITFIDKINSLYTLSLGDWKWWTVGMKILSLGDSTAGQCIDVTI